MPATATRRTKAKHADRCRLVLTIRGVAYAVRGLYHPSFLAYRLRKPDGVTYDVTDDVGCPSCTCGDQTWRHQDKDDSGCKHIRALRAVGLLGGGLDR